MILYWFSIRSPAAGEVYERQHRHHAGSVLVTRVLLALRLEGTLVLVLPAVLMAQTATDAYSKEGL